jgi:hypothetical protein
MGDNSSPYANPHVLAPIHSRRARRSRVAEPTAEGYAVLNTSSTH